MMGTAHTTPIDRIRHYLSLVKFSHTVFALPFAFIGFTIGVLDIQQTGMSFAFEWGLLFKMLLCMVFARSAAMAFNRYLDRRYDAMNPRTAKREIPAGVISPRQGLLFTIVSSMLFVVTTWFINSLCFLLSFVALFVVLFYSYTKRFTSLCHLVLGVGLALSPIGAYIAVTGEFSLLPLLFSFSVLTWVAGFDIIYALQDETFDKEHNLHSIPAALGVRMALMVSSGLHVLAAVFVIWAGFVGTMHFLYWIGVAIYVSMLVYQHILVKPNDLSKIGIAFANTNGVASVLFAIFTILSLILR